MVTEQFSRHFSNVSLSSGSSQGNETIDGKSTAQKSHHEAALDEMFSNM